MVALSEAGGRDLVAHLNSHHRFLEYLLKIHEFCYASIDNFKLAYQDH